MTTKDLAEYFEVSKRTILRDIESLSVTGFPIYTEKGRAGGVSILETFTMNRSLLSHEEREKILLALQSIVMVSNEVDEKLVLKLQRLFSSREPSWLEVDFSRWGHQKEDQQKFDLLKKAIIEKQITTFSYANTKGEMDSKKVYPMKLMYRSRSWYLQAYCSKNQVNRFYKVSRMTDLLVTEENFLLERQEQAFFQNEKEESKNLVRLQLSFSKELAYRVFDEFDASEIELDDNGGLLVTTTVPEDQWIYSFLLSFGTGVQIISPLYIKESLVNQIQKMLKHYQ